MNKERPTMDHGSLWDRSGLLLRFMFVLWFVFGMLVPAAIVFVFMVSAWLMI